MKSGPYRYMALGEIAEVVDPTGRTTRYGYDPNNRLTKVEQWRFLDETLADVRQMELQTTLYERNRSGEVVAVRSPLDDVVKYRYDGDGNLVSKVDEDGLETLHEYNLAGRLAKTSYADGKTVEFSYNLLRQLTEMRDWLGTTTIQVDKLGRAEQVTDFEGKTVAYGWDALGRREKMIYPDQSEVAYQYDRGGRLEKVRSSSGETRYDYDSLGRLSRRTLPNDIATEYTYNPLNRLEGLVHRRTGEAVDEFHYRYDPAGNMTEIEKHRSGLEVDSGVFQYAYDPLGRLVEAVHGGSRKEYRYDSLGNRVASLQNGAETRHHYNARNQLIRTEEAGAVTEYGYDRRGNLTRVAENGTVKSSYVFDASNRMTEAVVADKGRAEYAYNGFLDRVKRLEELRTSEHNPADPCQEMRYILDMTLPYNNLLMTEGQQNQSFIWGNELLAANGEESFHYLQDHLGSPIRLLGEDGAGTPLAYDEFGVPQVVTGESKANPFGFTGYQMDDVSGLYYAQARYYEPQIGRFGAEGGAKDGVNWYGYCGANPLRTCLVSFRSRHFGKFYCLFALSSLPCASKAASFAPKIQQNLARKHDYA